MNTSPSWRLVPLVVLECWLAAPQSAVAAATEELDDALRRCAQQADTSARLACFDAVVVALPQVKADRFGITADIKRQREPDAVQRAKSEMLTGKIAALRQGAHGELIFTLDNQQVWNQVEPRASIEFRVGENVRIEHGAMSSLWLVADKHRKIRVRRVT
jgi:hypothetical protein